MNTNLYMGGISYILGENETSLENNIYLKTDRKSQIFLRTMGFSNYYTSNRSLGELSEICVRNTLKKANLSAEDIDYVFYSSSTFGDRHGDLIDKDVAKCMLNVGLNNKYPIGIYLSQCNNFFATLDVATQYLKSNSNKTALLIFADRVLDENTRFKNLAINSDAASSCIITNKKALPLDFEIKSNVIKTSLTVDNLIDPITNNINIPLHNAYLDGIKETFESAIDSKYRSRLNSIITHNFSYSALKQIANTIGVSYDLIYKDNIKKFGHAYTSDSLINLDTYYSANHMNIPNDFNISVIGTGLYFWGCIHLRKGKNND